MSQFANYRDFTKKRAPVGFTIGEQKFHCYRSLSPKRLQRAIRTFRETKAEVEGGIDESNAEEMVGRIVNVLEFFIKKESFTRFRDLVMAEDDEEGDEENDDNGVDLQQLLGIVQYLVEQQGLRPLEPSSDSSSTSANDDGGTSSTAGAQHAELIS